MFEIFSLEFFRYRLFFDLVSAPRSLSFSLGVNRPVGGEMEEEADRQVTFKTSLFVGICGSFGKFTCSKFGTQKCLQYDIVFETRYMYNVDCVFLHKYTYIVMFMIRPLKRKHFLLIT